MSYHDLPISLSFGEDTKAYCSISLPDDLVLFVHGFNGKSLKTWGDFPDFLFSSQKFRHADLVFYGYDSLKGQTANIGLDFYDTITALSLPGVLPDFSIRQLPAQHAYKRIILVAHSLGAVITRYMLLDAHRRQAPWLEQVQLFFYAPAHHGSRIPENFKDCLEGMGKILEGLIVTKYPIIKDLTEDSLVLRNIRDQTTALLQAGQAPFVQARVMWARKEVVVINYPYCEDYPENQINDTTHTSVCKPLFPRFVEPFEFLEKHI